jgi:dihydropteroate synthase
VAATGAALVLMHNRGRPRDMYREASYEDVAGEIVQELEHAVSRAVDRGIRRQAIVVDPGLGFAKKSGHSFAALTFLDHLAELDRPILSGPSRKSFLKQALGELPPEEREWGTAAAVAASVLFGAHIVRVHGVKEMAQVVSVADQVRQTAERRTTELRDQPL